MKFLDDIVAAQKNGEHRGITSVCSAHPLVLEAAMRHAKLNDLPVLIEATCNQVNQFGGYTGMKPDGFICYVQEIARKTNFPVDRLILGGDHLGPLVWADESAQNAMVKAKSLVREYARAGFSKIHLDCSMPCQDDKELPIELIARRTAELAKVVEETFADQNTPSTYLPRYVIGSEVPSAGGVKAGVVHPHITNPDAVAETIEYTKKAFHNLDLQSAWERVIAVVVQPGVEFGDEEILAYDTVQTRGLVRFIETNPRIIFEAHSTDYQIRTDLFSMVQDQFGILKVGPALTFAFREAVFSLAQIEEIQVETEPSNIRAALEKAMLEKPSLWQKHYRGSSQQQRISRLYSYSDRIRYYWNAPGVVASFDHLLFNLGKNALPLSLISQYLPAQYEKIRQGTLNNTPYDLILGQINDVLEDYRFACSSK